MKNIAYLMYSGGLDSSYQFLKLCAENKYGKLCPIFFNYGQRNAAYEEKSVIEISDFLKHKYKTKIIGPIIINARASLAGTSGDSLFPWSLGEPITGEAKICTDFPSVEIENKNLVLYSLLVSYILSSLRKNSIERADIDIYTGLRDNEMGDASSSFFIHINEALHLYHEHFYFHVLFIDNRSPMSIIESIINIVEDRKIAKEFMSMTASCYNPCNSKPCMKCSKCRQLKKVYEKIKNL